VAPPQQKIGCAAASEMQVQFFCCFWHDGCWEGHSECLGRIGASGNDFGCREEAVGVWGGLVVC
jgi:hypothetical protein